jgi:hypothetical protein
MFLNTTPPEPARKPCIRDYAELTSTLLTPALVALVPLSELERRCEEINLTHPRFKEETPLVLAFEQKRRNQLSRWMHKPAGAVQVA